MPISGSQKNALPILLVDDEPQLLLTAKLILEKAGFHTVIPLQDSREVLPVLERQGAAVVLLDLLMPHRSGSELLEEINNAFPQVPVIVVTARNDVDTAVRCIRSGALDYIVKPFDKSRLLSSVSKALEVGRLRRELSSMKTHFLSGGLNNPDAFSPIVTRNRKMYALFQYMEVIGSSPQAVLLTGETGVGKDFFARALHRLSGRSGDLVPVNISGLDDIVFSDTLFGHLKGAFTGADREREGLIARASRGTLFLDEIGDLREAGQVKLLRLLQEQEYYPLGSDRPRRSDARIIVATNCSLPTLIEEGRFRKDLFFRLRGHQITIPPLRERLDDLPLLLDLFLEEAAVSMQKRTPTPPPELVGLLSAYQFPGNVRELRALVFDAVARHRSGVLSMSSFREATGIGAGSDAKPGSGQGDEALSPSGLSIEGRFPTLKEAEQFLIREALRRARDNQGIAASLLGINRTTFNKRLNKKNQPT